MIESSQRYVDVIIALKVADSFGQQLGRIQLQKYVYLADTISVIWELLSPRNGHETYKHGPFDFAINNAADVLAFRGLVDVMSIRMEEKHVDVLYSINKIGNKLYDELNSETYFQKKIDLYREIGKHVDVIGWKKLRELVYAEPTYKQSRATGYGYQFDYLSLFSNESLRILYEFENMMSDGQKISKSNMVALFFKLLS